MRCRPPANPDGSPLPPPPHPHPHPPPPRPVAAPAAESKRGSGLGGGSIRPLPPPGPSPQAGGTLIGGSFSNGRDQNVCGLTSSITTTSHPPNGSMAVGGPIDDPAHVPRGEKRGSDGDRPRGTSNPRARTHATRARATLNGRGMPASFLLPTWGRSDCRGPLEAAGSPTPGIPARSEDEDDDLGRPLDSDGGQSPRGSTARSDLPGRSDNGTAACRSRES